MRLAGRWVLAALALALVAGCSGSVRGAPRETAPSIDAPPWDPCTIPDAAIDAAGLDLSTKESGIFGKDQNGFKICSWDDAPPADSYSITVFSARKGLDWLERSNTYERLESVHVGSRNAVQYQTIGADPTLKCGLAFAAGDTLLLATFVANPLVDTTGVDPCAQLNSIMARIETSLPT